MARPGGRVGVRRDADSASQERMRLPIVEVSRLGLAVSNRPPCALGLHRLDRVEDGGAVVDPHHDW
jgi:hypothetical protein